jgi:two-component system chemotaxis response regulator CheB
MKIRAMIISDSVATRKNLSKALESDRSIEVVCKLGDEEGVDEMVEWISPDIGLIKGDMCSKEESDLFESFFKKKIPVIVIGEENEKKCDLLIDLLERGAIDYLTWQASKSEVVKKVKNASKTSPIRFANPPSKLKIRFPIKSGLRKVVVIASSTGGPQALRHILPKIPKKFPGAFIIIQHIGNGFATSIASSLNKISEIRVKEAKDGEKLKKGTAYVAPYGHHLIIEDETIHLEKGEPVNGVIPSADLTMKSVAEWYGMDSIGVVLTGMGKDGARGLGEIKKKHGRTIVQDRGTSVVFGMPQSALKTGNVDKVVDVTSIPEALMKEVNG